MFPVGVRRKSIGPKQYTRSASTATALRHGHSLSLILLHENGYKVFTETAGGEDSGLAMVEVQGKILCLAEGDIDDADNAAQVRLEPAVQTTLRNQNPGE